MIDDNTKRQLIIEYGEGKYNSGLFTGIIFGSLIGSTITYVIIKMKQTTF
jgi:hypothetical protein